MYKVGIVGDKDSVLAFKAIGIEVFPVDNVEDARKTVDTLAYNNYGVIFITEQFAEKLEETIERYSKSITPSIILIPGSQGSLGIGLNKIKDNVQKAVGINIL
ncbi:MULTISPECIES: V-type ATP synthase subunit F [Clostridium]|jgi:V/A-type H+-transporting ATPase subunit F|uniref:V-type ATP synthase subunit F n=1 Tax=Clostridium TaxID=1485 RepID=UPI000999268A|nr:MULTISPECIES: V-type ATP synthase subunit F [Clostridium]